MVLNVLNNQRHNMANLFSPYKNFYIKKTPPQIAKLIAITLLIITLFIKLPFFVYLKDKSQTISTTKKRIAETKNICIFVISLLALHLRPQNRTAIPLPSLKLSESHYFFSS